MSTKNYLTNIFKKLKKTRNILIIIIIVSALLRLPSITWGAPKGSYYGDELVYTDVAYSIYPGIENYKPSRDTEIMVPKFATLHFIAGNFIFSLFAGTELLTKAVGVVIARIISVIYGVLTVVMVYFITKEIFNNKKTALLAAFFMGISRLPVQESHLSTPASMALFYTALALYLIIFGYKKKSMKHLLLASVSTGLIAAAYWRFFTIVPLIFTSFSLKSWKKKVATIFLSLMIVPFVFTCAGVITDFQNTLGMFKGAAVTKHGAYNGKIGTFYEVHGSGFILHPFVTIPRAVGYPIFLVGVLLILKKSSGYIKDFFIDLKKKKFKFNPGLILIIWLLCEFVGVGLFNVPEDRRALPSTLGLVCFASAFFSNMGKKKKIFLSCVISYTLIITLMCEYNFAGENDTRDIARRWFNANIEGNITYCRNVWYAPGGLNGIAISCGNKDNRIINGLENNADYLILAHLWYYRFTEGKINWTFYVLYNDLFANKTGYRPIKVFRKVTPPTYESIVYYLFTDANLLLPEWVNNEIWIFKRIANTSGINWTDVEIRARNLEQNHVKPYYYVKPYY